MRAQQYRNQVQAYRTDYKQTIPVFSIQFVALHKQLIHSFLSSQAFSLQFLPFYSKFVNQVLNVFFEGESFQLQVRVSWFPMN